MYADVYKTTITTFLFSFMLFGFMVAIFLTSKGK